MRGKPLKVLLQCSGGTRHVEVVREEAFAAYELREMKVVACATAHELQRVALAAEGLLCRLEEVVGERLVLEVERELQVV